jgi:hypothetical protein
MSKAAASPNKDDSKERPKKRPRLVTPDMALFEPKFEHVKWSSSVNQQALAADVHDPSHVLACLMIKYNREAFIADVRGKLSWTEAGPVGKV